MNEELYEDHELCIVVIDNGFIFVGNCSTNEKWVYITEARPVIRWGTKEGLSQLANNGPLKNTKLGEEQKTTNKTPISRLLNIIPCNRDKWNG